MILLQNREDWVPSLRRALTLRLRKNYGYGWYDLFLFSLHRPVN